MTKNFPITITIEDVGYTTSYLQVTDGIVSTELAEEDFYKLLRKTEKALIKDVEEEERSQIIATLTPAQEEKLKEVHMKDYRGTDDDAPDAYDEWLMSDVSLEELKSIL